MIPQVDHAAVVAEVEVAAFVAAADTSGEEVVYGVDSIVVEAHGTAAWAFGMEEGTIAADKVDTGASSDP